MTFTHGHARKSGYSPEYITWKGMVGRCQQTYHTCYYKYGAKGISVCDRWLKFEAFLEDMGPKPTAKHSIDRIDPKGNYEPSNCRWATMREQQNNRTSNRLLPFNGEMLTMAEASRRSGIAYDTLKRRANLGWPEEKLYQHSHGRFPDRTVRAA